MSEMINIWCCYLVLVGIVLVVVGMFLVVWVADVLKVGLIVLMLGLFVLIGWQIEVVVKLYQQKFGDSVVGCKVEILLKDDGGVFLDVIKWLVQELVVWDKV